MVEQKIIEIETQRRVYNFILKYPGLHLRELIRKLKIPYGTLRYHLRCLDKQGLVKSIKEDGYVRFYVTNSIGNNQKKMFSILRQEIPRNIILYMLSTACASQIELSKELEKHPTTIEFHLKKLIKMGIVEHAPVDRKNISVNCGGLTSISRKQNGKEVIYRLKDPFSTYNSLVTYKSKSYDDFCNIPSIHYKFWHYGDHINRYKSFKYIGEYCEEILYEICPHPYHA